MLEPPERLARRPRDKRGYVIPWNVLVSDNGEPIFTVNDSRTHLVALEFELCPICGTPLARERWCVGGPRSAFDPHGWYLDLPGHQECIEYALQVCPYLAAPRYEGRIDIPDMSKVPHDVPKIFFDDTVIPERPALFVAVGCLRIEQKRNPHGLPYVRPVKPWTGVQYWRHGQRLADKEGEFLARAIVFERGRGNADK